MFESCPKQLTVSLGCFFDEYFACECRRGYRLVMELCTSRLFSDDHAINTFFYRLHDVPV